MNCVNCSIATDSTLAGRPASAMPGGATPLKVLQDFFGGVFRPISGKVDAAKALSEAGPGARAIVFGGRQGGTGHVFNGANQGGNVRFLDGQTGKTATFEGYDYFFMMRTN